MNKIKEKFEELLGSLKSAGAELLFTSKKSHLDKDEEIRWKQMNEDYKLGMNFVKELETGESTREVCNMYDSCYSKVLIHHIIF